MVSLVKDDKNRSKDQKLKEKKCMFPNCKTKFLGRGQSKYCEEHKKSKYKSSKYNKERKNKIGDSNIEINHNNTESSTIIRPCGLDGCGVEYTINVTPNQYIYPNYCEEHRNEYKREFFKKKWDEKHEKKK